MAKNLKQSQSRPQSPNDTQLAKGNPASVSHKNEENPTHYSGYKEDRDYSHNTSKLHPEPADRAHNNNQKNTGKRESHLANNQKEYSPNNLTSQDHYDSSPARKQKPDQKEGQGYKEGHSSSKYD